MQKKTKETTKKTGRGQKLFHITVCIYRWWSVAVLVPILAHLDYPLMSHNIFQLDHRCSLMSSSVQSSVSHNSLHLCRLRVLHPLGEQEASNSCCRALSGSLSSLSPSWNQTERCFTLPISWERYALRANTVMDYKARFCSGDTVWTKTIHIPRLYCLNITW